MSQLTCSQLRSQKIDQLEEKLDELKENLSTLRMKDEEKGKHQLVTDLRQSIARVNIVQNQSIKENLRKFYHGEKHKPKDLRKKQTRAIRRQLTTKEQSIELKKVQKRSMMFPQRNFALKD